jgi:hypothetical protein
VELSAQSEYDDYALPITIAGAVVFVFAVATAM